MIIPRRRRSQRYYEKALKLCKAGKPESAIDYLEKAAHYGPNAHASYMRASLMKSLGRKAEAAEAFCLYYEMRLRYQEGQRACELAITSLAEERLLLKACLMVWRARFTRLCGQSDLARDLRAESQSLIETARRAGRQFVAGPHEGAHCHVTGRLPPAYLRRFSRLHALCL